VADLALLASAQMLVRSPMRYDGDATSPRLTPVWGPPRLHQSFQSRNSSSHHVQVV